MAEVLPREVLDKPESYWGVSSKVPGMPLVVKSALEYDEQEVRQD